MLAIADALHYIRADELGFTSQKLLIKSILREPIPAQIRELILYYYYNK